jgi:hypothetical protein
VGEHVERGHLAGAVAARGEPGEIAGQRVRIAGEIGDGARGEADDLGEHRCGAAPAGRVEDDEVGAVYPAERGDGVAGDEASARGAFEGGRGGGVGDRARVGLDPERLGAGAGEGERDAADAAVDVDGALAGARGEAAPNRGVGQGRDLPVGLEERARRQA